VALIINCGDYTQTRKKGGFFANFSDLPDAYMDGRVATGALIQLNWKKENIERLCDPTKDQLAMAFMELGMKVVKAKKAGKKVCVVICYGGHGIQDGTTHAVLNDAGENHLFSLEAQANALASSLTNCYVVLLADCCREKVETRGSGNEESKQAERGNIIITFGCAAGKTVTRGDDVTANFFATLIAAAKKDKKGLLKLPNAITNFGNKTGKAINHIRARKLRLKPRQFFEETVSNSGNKYIGEKLDGKKNGHGRNEHANGQIYEGDWQNGK
jgi:hypothetical protein